MNKAVKSILIVDDEVDICELLAMQMEMRGYHVLQAHNGIDALEVVKQNSVDFILSDVRMPKGDGVSFLKSLKEENIDIPLVFITGYADITREDAIELGAKNLLYKPLDSKSLYEIIDTTLAGD